MILSFLQFTFFSVVAFGAEPNPEEILKKADDIRNPLSSFKMMVSVASDDGNETSFEVMTKGKEKTLIKTTAPARDKGRNMLILKEDMWLFIPKLGRAVRVALSDKLTGQAANGDISRMRWTGDYDSTLEKSEAKQWVLFLKAQRKGLTYEKIRLWVEKESYRPVKAEYLSLQDQPLKLAEFQEYKKLAGSIRPTQIKISDARKSTKFSVIKIKELTSENFNDSMFQQTNLK